MYISTRSVFRSNLNIAATVFFERRNRETQKKKSLAARTKNSTYTLVAPTHNNEEGVRAGIIVQMFL